MGLDAVHPGFVLTEPPPCLHDKSTKHVFIRGLLFGWWCRKTWWWLQDISRVGIGKVFMVSQAQIVMGGKVIGGSVVVVLVVYVLTLFLL